MTRSEDPVFTVIISTYNRREMLPKAIESVLSQTFGDFELLVIDNGSTDGTPVEMKKIRDPRIKFIINPEPTGSCDGPRNMGMAMARGRYIAFLDDDDIWYPERLEKVLKAFEGHPDVGAVCHNEYFNYKGREKRLLRWGPWSEDLHERLLYEGNRLSSCATTVKRDLARRLGGFDLREEFSAAADYDFWLRMTAAGTKVFFIDEPLGEFGFTGLNRSTADCAFQSRIAHLVEYHIMKTEGRPLFGLSTRGLKRISRLYLSAARAFLRGGKILSAVAYLGRAAAIVLRRPAVVMAVFNMKKKSCK